MSEQLRRTAEQQNGSDFDILNEAEKNSGEAAISKPIADFLKQNGIETTDLPDGLTRQLYDEDDINNVWRGFIQSKAHAERIFVGDVIGSQAINDPDGRSLVGFLSQLYSSGSSYKERSNQYLRRDMRENVERLLGSNEPMDFVGDGEKYFLCGDGNHRLFYLAAALEIELQNASSPEERRKICERYTIPANVCDVEFPSSVEKNTIDGLEDEEEREGKLVVARGISEVRERENGSRILYSDYLSMYPDFKKRDTGEMNEKVRRQIGVLIHKIGFTTAILDLNETFQNYITDPGARLDSRGRKGMKECFGYIDQILELGRENGCESEVEDLLSELEDKGDAGSFIVAYYEVFGAQSSDLADNKENEPTLDEKLQKLDNQYIEIRQDPRGIDIEELRDLNTKYQQLVNEAKNSTEETKILERKRRVTRLIESLEDIDSRF